MLHVRVKLIYPESLMQEALISSAVLETGVLINLRRAEITDDGGFIICEFVGDKEVVDAGMKWFESRGVTVETLGAEI